MKIGITCVMTVIADHHRILYFMFDHNIPEKVNLLNRSVFIRSRYYCNIFHSCFLILSYIGERMIGKLRRRSKGIGEYHGILKLRKSRKGMQVGS